MIQLPNTTEQTTAQLLKTIIARRHKGPPSQKNPPTIGRVTLKLEQAAKIDEKWLVGWCLMAFSAQQGYIMPCEDWLKFVKDIYFGQEVENMLFSGTG